LPFLKPRCNLRDYPINYRLLLNLVLKVGETFPQGRVLSMQGRDLLITRRPIMTTLSAGRDSVLRICLQQAWSPESLRPDEAATERVRTRRTFC
jgi:hypothetical protein